jgi:hypothetical protein
MNLPDALDFCTGLPPIRQRMKGKAEKITEIFALSALRRTKLYFRTAISRETRKEKTGVLPVLQKRFTEIGGEELFLFSRLSIKTDDDNCEREQTWILACCER